MNDALIFFCSNIASLLGELYTIGLITELGLGVDRKQHILLTTELQIGCLNFFKIISEALSFNNPF